MNFLNILKNIFKRNKINSFIFLNLFILYIINFFFSQIYFFIQVNLIINKLFFYLFYQFVFLQTLVDIYLAKYLKVKK